MFAKETTCLQCSEYNSNQTTPIDTKEMSKTWVLYLFLMVATTLSGHSNQAKFQKCGSLLSTLLAMVCDSRYNTPIINKRSVPPIPILEMMDASSFAENNVPQLSLGDILLPRKRAIQVLKGKRRVKRGVYDECCKKPCTYAELYDYCATS